MKATAKEIGREIADAGALIGSEGKAVASTAAHAIRAERKRAVTAAAKERRRCANIARLAGRHASTPDGKAVADAIATAIENDAL